MPNLRCPPAPAAGGSSPTEHCLGGHEQQGLLAPPSAGKAPRSEGYRGRRAMGRPHGKDAQIGVPHVARPPRIAAAGSLATLASRRCERPRWSHHFS
eukprot:scaffold11097_cov31-Tisochrysis_lutea.AAC.1